MKRLLQQIQETKVQGVIVYKLDRFTRRSKDFEYLLELFEKHNVAFISATESIDTKSPQGRLMTNIMVQFAQYDRELDQERSKDTHLARAQKGLWCGGLPPFGYDSKNKLLVVNKKEAKVVRLIYEKYLRFGSVEKVVKEMNLLGYKRKIFKTKNDKLYGGGKFDKNVIIRVLRNKIYLGLIVNYRTGKEFKARHKPIIDKRTFETVQKMMNEHICRHKSTKANKHHLLLQGIVKCGICGSNMVGYAASKKRPKENKLYLYYRCTRGDNGTAERCSMKNIGAEQLEKFVMDRISELGKNKEMLDRTLKRVNQKMQKGVNPLRKEKKEIELKLKTVKTEIQNMINFIKSTPDNMTVSEELTKLECLKDDLERQNLELDVKIRLQKQAVFDADAIAGMLQRFGLFFSKLEFYDKYTLVHLLIRKVKFSPTKIGIRIYDLPDKNIKKLLEVPIDSGSMCVIPCGDDGI